MRQLLRNIVLIGIGLVAGIAATIQLSATAQQGANTLPLDELRTLSNVFGQIKREYVEPIEDKQLLTEPKHLKLLNHRNPPPQQPANPKPQVALPAPRLGDPGPVRCGLLGRLIADGLVAVGCHGSAVCFGGVQQYPHWRAIGQ